MINPTSPNANPTVLTSDSGTAGGMTRKLLGTGLNSTQVTQLLTQLKEAGRINGVGTPSREEVIQPNESRGMNALGGLFNDTGMDNMMIEFATNPSLRRVTADSLWDISLVTIHVPDIGEKTVAQVYPSDTAAPQMGSREFAELISANPAKALTAEQQLEGILRSKPDSIVPFGQDLSLGELQLRLTSLVKNHRVNVIIAPSTPGEAEVNLNKGELIDSIQYHLDKALKAANNNPHARFKLSIRSHHSKAAILGQNLQVANIEVSDANAKSSHRTKTTDVNSKGEIVAEGLSQEEASKALSLLWNDHKLDLVGFGSYKRGIGGKAVFPSTSFKDDLGKNVGSIERFFDLSMKKLGRQFSGTPKFDLILSPDSPCKRGPNNEIANDKGFLVKCLVDDN